MPYSNNGDLEHLVEQITDVIVARLNGDREEQAALCGCTNECFNRCPERMHRIVDAGAARIGLVLGETASARDWASLIDHTLLKPEATEDDIKRLCEEAAQFRFASVRGCGRQPATYAALTFPSALSSVSRSARRSLM